MRLLIEIVNTGGICFGETGYRCVSFVVGRVGVALLYTCSV